MILWIDAQLSPALAPWISQQFAVEAYSARWLGLTRATDQQIFEAARKANAVVMTKDSDFLRLLELHGPPPQVIWVTLGNTANARLREVCGRRLSSALRLLESGEALVEIGELLT